MRFATACATRVFPMPPGPRIVTTGMLAQQRRDRGEIIRAAIEPRNPRRKVAAGLRPRRSRGRVGRHRAPLDGRCARRGVGQRDGQVEPVAAPGNRREGALAEDLAQGRHLHLQVVLLDHEPRPNHGEKVVLRDQRAGALRERHQQIERARAQRDRRAVRQQDAFVRAQLEPAEAAGRCVWRRGGRVAHVRTM